VPVYIQIIVVDACQIDKQTLIFACKQNDLPSFSSAREVGG
jgi:hypothetical protein